MPRDTESAARVAAVVMRFALPAFERAQELAPERIGDTSTIEEAIEVLRAHGEPVAPELEEVMRDA